MKTNYHRRRIPQHKALREEQQFRQKVERNKSKKRRIEEIEIDEQLKYLKGK